MKKLNKIILGGCVVCAVMSVGCSRQAQTTDTQSQAVVNASAGNTSSTDASADKSALDRSSLAQRIEDSGQIDVSAVDTELDRIRQDMIIDRYLEHLYDNAVSEQAVESHYRDNIGDYASREIELQHILVRIPANASDEQDAALQTKARELIAKLHAGESFSVLAQAHSDDAVSAEQGGALGWVSEHDLDKSVMNAALSLQAGDVSEPIGTDYGVHIVKAVSDVREIHRPLADVRPRIVQKLRAEAKAKAFEQLAMTE